jgi:hypothetical protein
MFNAARLEKSAVLAVRIIGHKVSGYIFVHKYGCILMSSCFRMFSAKIKMTKLLVSGKCKAASASLHEGASKRGRTIPLILVVLLLYVLIPSPTILQSD